jgi:type I restriction enzyme R subunit
MTAEPRCALFHGFRETFPTWSLGPIGTVFQGHRPSAIKGTFDKLGVMPAAVNESEWQTRKARIDPKLRASGWRIVPHRPDAPLAQFDRCAIEEYPTDNGPADYALCAGGQILGVVEGKKVTLGPQNVLTQAERYSRGLTANPLRYTDGFRVPFLYSTNGEVVWHHDIRHQRSRSRKIAEFHSPDALTERLAADFDAACRQLLATPNDHPRLRPYQRDANEAVEQAIANQRRRMLVAMATGTGKTFTTVNQVYRLMKAGVAKRILFLVDRRALAAQAVRAFASHEPEPGLKFNNIYEVYSQRFRREDFDEDDDFDPTVLPGSYLTAPQPGKDFVYVCTIQRMMVNLFGRDAIFAAGDEPLDDDAAQVDIPIHAFDLIIADECHRGYTASEAAIWRRTLDHFDAIKVGLTATPAAHTTSYFEHVAYRYEYERAVREGHLVDYDAVTIRSNVRMNGMFLQEGEQVTSVDPETGNERLDAIEDERQIDTAEVEVRATSPDSNRKILEEIRTYAQQHEQATNRFPKTLIFAVNDLPHTSHADQLVNLARDVFGQGDAFVQKITGRVDRPLQRIREFRNRPLPGVVVTVDMLSTGVDIPDLEFIVFLRPVKSRILFEQMLGRGTRKGERHPDKSHFVVFDCFDGTLLEYFREATAITAEPPETGTRTIIEVIDDIWSNRDRDYNIRCLVKRLQRIDKQMAPEARERFAAFIAAGDVAQFATNLPAQLRRDFTGTMNLLRNQQFQDLLMNYPRAARTFIVAHEQLDTVTSQWLVRGADGREYKPADYLIAFSQFVKDNPAHIEAIRILLDRPAEWSTDALSELRDKLASAPQRFTIDHLQRAHELHYHKALVDIISMVKRAARESEPLHTAEERVRIAFAKIESGRTFTPDQRQWLDRVRQHMIANLSIDREDFDSIPILAHAGGWGRANRDFDGKLADLLGEFNKAVAA